MKKPKRRHLTLPEISLTPLIDTALTLLIIFIVTAPMVQNGIKVNLPQGKSKEAGNQQELVVTLNKKNELYFNSYPVKKEELVTTVQKALEGKDDTPIYVRADQTVSYGNVIEIVDNLKQAGVKYVAMSTQPSTGK
ncbi:biopolymer transporter ExbD [Candidatus Babeliales bacterium]|nr:biopolymer transporter ExbD [Candidatus Babeliales bacterium]